MYFCHIGEIARKKLRDLISDQTSPKLLFQLERKFNMVNIIRDKGEFGLWKC